MFPNPWATSVPPPVSKPMVNTFDNSTQRFPFFAAQNSIPNMSNNQQNNLTYNATSVTTQSLQPNAIDPAMVQKWQEWKQWELWQQQFQQWQQQTGQIAAATPQPAPPMTPGQPPHPPIIPFQNQQYSYHLPTGTPLPQPTNQPQQITTKPEVGIKRGLEHEFPNNEKKLKIDTTNKKEIELTDETEALFEEQFKSWEEQFFKWKEQNKNHPDKVQYVEYEKKWLNWRDHLKQKCEILKKKREMKMAEKKKETIQVEENKVQSQQRSTCNPMMLNVPILTNEPPPNFQQLHNNSMVPSTSINQIPGLDLVSNNENITRGFLNVSNILPLNKNGPIQTPDDKPFNFPKSITNPSTINQPHLVNMPHGNINQPSMYPNSSNWSKYNNPIIYFNQKPPDVDNTSISRFDQQTDNSSRLPYEGVMSNTTYSSTQNAPSMDYRRPMDGSYNKSSNDSTSFNKSSDVQPFNRNVNASSSNFRGYNQSNSNASSFNNFNRPSEKSNIPYQQPLPSLINTTASKPPSLLSLNLVKPVALDNPGNYPGSKNVAPNRYDRNWNNADDEDDPENEYMEAHKKFSSEPFDDQNDEDKFSNSIQHRNVYNENNYSRGQQGARNFDDDHPRPLNQSRGSRIMRNSDNEYLKNNSQFSRNNNNQSYPCDFQAPKNNENDYYKPPNNKCVDQGFSREAPFSKDFDEDYTNKPFDKNNYASQKGNYGPPSRGNYESPRGNFGNYMDRPNMEWDKNYTKNEELQQPIQNIIDHPPQVIKKSFEEVIPIDPVKIFDYRHLTTLKVIPGLSKETIIPIRVYDYKHGGKRILPWQDRGFSRRNLNQTRDLNDDINQNENDDLNLSRRSVDENSTIPLNDISYGDKNENVVNIADEIKEEETTAIIDTTTVIDDDEEKEEILKPENEVMDICAPSPPRMSLNNIVEKPYNRKLLTIETLLCPPGRLNRPSKIVIVLRGLPGSGKSYVAKLIKEKEVAMGGQAPRILSLDDYFMTEVTKTEIDPETNKKVEKKVMEYEYDSAIESLYRTSFIKAFKKKMLENYFSFYIIDAVNNKVTYYKDILEISKINGFTIYIIELESDVDLCIKRNIHNRTAQDINSIMQSWVRTPDDQILLDIQSLLHSTSNTEMEMEDVSDIEMELDKDEETVDNSNSVGDKNIDFEEEDVMKLLSCKWTDTIPQEEKMKRLDGLCKKKSESSIKEWLQIPEDDYSMTEQQVVVKDGKKRVRWADMEERREQEKMRAIGFVVGQTNWDRMLGRDQGESKLTQTKYI